MWPGKPNRLVRFNKLVKEKMTAIIYLNITCTYIHKLEERSPKPYCGPSFCESRLA